MQLRPYQNQLVADLRKSMAQGNKATLCQLPTGGGKCLGKDTPILMIDGTVKMVQDIEIGDLLIGPNSQPRIVLSTCTGKEMLYRVTPTKGDPYIVNESHILSLKITNTGKNDKTYCNGIAYKAGDIASVTVAEYLAASKTFKHLAKGYRKAVEFMTEQDLVHDPYFIGLWLGDGSSNSASVTTGDKEIINYLDGYSQRWNCKLRIEPNSENSVIVHIIGNAKTGRGGLPFKSELKKLNLINNKHIPFCYKSAPENYRLSLLAGVIDSDGHYDGKQFSITLKNELLLDDIIFVARSLGMAAYKKKALKKCYNNGVIGSYFRCNISGDIDRIPCLLERKKANPRRQKKSVLVTGIKVESIGIGDYYGFEITGDRLFMLGDFTVTHNTVAFAHIAQAAAAKGKRIAIIAHRRELVSQATRALAINSRLPQNISVHSVQTLVRRLEATRPADLIILDECHHIAAGSWAKIFDWHNSAGGYTLGFTATPRRLDGRGLAKYFQHMVQGPTVAELMDMGYLCRYQAYSLPAAEALAHLKLSFGDYNQAELGELAESGDIHGDPVAHYGQIMPGKRAVVFCVNIKHAEATAERFRQAGYNSRCLHAGLHDAVRDALLNEFAAGRIQVLTNCDIVSEGFDLPALDGVIMLRPTASETLYLQQVGRALRPSEGKERAILIDHVGNIVRHGLPDDEREWKLEYDKKRKAGGAPSLSVAVCPTCFTAQVSPIRVCISCGYVPESATREVTEVVTTQLEVVDKDALEKLKQQKQRNSEVGSARTLEALQAIGVARGYKPNWALILYNSRQK